MSKPASNTQSCLADPRKVPFLNYLMLFLMVLTVGMTGVIALRIASFREDDAPDWLKSHYEFQRRTFWLGVAPIIACLVVVTVLRTQGILSLALVLVPLIAVDGRGTRLGRGKGHYDRALTRLKKNRARLIGVGWSPQRLVDTIPRDEWDVPLDAFASPDGLEWFGQVPLPF